MIANVAEITPKFGDRAAIFGQTGSGKTTLARVFCQDRQNVIVCDPKRRIDWPGYYVLRDWRELNRIDPTAVRKIVYKPTHDDINKNKGAVINAFFRWVFERENCLLYVDELSMISRGDDYPSYYGMCLTQGRELGIEVISGTQRPTYIPQIAMSEAEHIYCFFLKMFYDQQRVERFSGIPAEKIADLQKRQFFYAPQDGAFVGPLTLEIRQTQRAVA